MLSNYAVVIVNESIIRKSEAVLGRLRHVGDCLTLYTTTLVGQCRNYSSLIGGFSKNCKRITKKIVINFFLTLKNHRKWKSTHSMAFPIVRRFISTCNTELILYRTNKSLIYIQSLDSGNHYFLSLLSHSYCRKSAAWKSNKGRIYYGSINLISFTCFIFLYDFMIYWSTSRLLINLRFVNNR